MSPRTMDDSLRTVSSSNYGSIDADSHAEKEIELLIPPPPIGPVLIKTQSNFWQDLYEFRSGSLPHSMILAVSIGFLCGAAAFVYYWFLEFMLEFVWKSLPQAIMTHVDEKYHILWIPTVGFTFAFLLGCTVKFMGDPGDLPYTIHCVHEKAYVAMDHVLPMVVASQFSILAGGSLGPEAPLVAICAALGGWVSRHIYGVTEKNLVRKHTLMGMAGALAAFFGCPLGGSIFALEVNSRFGIEYFEHTVEAILCGEVCLAVFRCLAALPIAPIWNFTLNGHSGEAQFSHLMDSRPSDVVHGMLLGLVGAAVAIGFARFHENVMVLFKRLGLIDNGKNAIQRAMLGAAVVVSVGVLVPYTLFWGEYEIQAIATMAPASSLPHIWPTSGGIDFEMNSFVDCLLVGLGKLITISFTVAGGYRGGFIFPAFAAGCALGRAIYFLVPGVPLQHCMLCMAAAINVGLTRTALSTTIILVFLSGEQNSMTPVLAASLVSLFVTGYSPFITSQAVRSNVEESSFQHANPVLVDDARNLSSLVQRLRKKASSDVTELVDRSFIIPPSLIV